MITKLFQFQLNILKHGQAEHIVMVLTTLEKPKLLMYVMKNKIN